MNNVSQQKQLLSTRQICFILIAYNAVLKLLIYPSYLAGQCGSALVLSALANLILHTAVIWSVAFLSSRTDKTFFALVKDSLGSVAARIIYALLGLYFLFGAIIPLSEQQLFTYDAFYDTVPSLYVFLPVFAFLIYAGSKPLANLGRCADVAFPIFVAAISAIIFMSVGQGNYANLLPVFDKPAKTVAGGALASLFRFSEGAFLLIFMGNFKYKKGDCAKLTVSYLAGGLIVILLLAVFWATYGALTPSRTFILSNVAAFFPVISLLGRVDLVAAYATDTVVLFAIAMHIQACVYCMCTAFKIKERALISVLANAALIIIAVALNHRQSALFSASGWFFIPALLFAYFLPLSAWLFKRRKQ